MQHRRQICVNVHRSVSNCSRAENVLGRAGNNIKLLKLPPPCSRLQTVVRLCKVSPMLFTDLFTGSARLAFSARYTGLTVCHRPRAKWGPNALMRMLNLGLHVKMGPQLSFRSQNRKVQQNSNKQNIFGCPHDGDFYLTKIYKKIK